MSFPPNTLVSMAAGGEKPIRDVVIGDTVRGMEGDVTVTGLFRVALGPRKRPARGGLRPLFRINDRIEITGDHLMWTNRGWGCVEVDRYARGSYERKLPIITEPGKRAVTALYHAPHPDDVVPFGPARRRGVLLFHLEGWKLVDSVVDMAPGRRPGTRLFGLKTEPSGTVFCNGYLVAAWADRTKFDWAKGKAIDGRKR